MSLVFQALYRFGEFEVDPIRRVLKRSGAQVPVSPKAFDVLYFLVRNPARVVTKEELLKAVWPESFVEEGNLTQHISALRKALGAEAAAIVTIPGRGYQFSAAVEQISVAGATAAAGESQPQSATASQSEEYVIQRVRERTQIVIEEPLADAVRNTHASWLTRRSFLGATMALLLLGAVGAYLWKRLEVAPAMHKVLVADFINLTGDSQFDHTLKIALEDELGQSPYLQIMGGGEERSQLERMEKAPDTPLLGDTAMEVCRRNQYEVMVRGTIRSSVEKGNYLVTVDAVGCESGRLLGSYKAEASEKDKVLDTFDTLSASIRRRIGESHESIAAFQVPTTMTTTFSFEALQASHEGEVLGNAGKLKECIPYFEKAVALDPKFAMAQADLGTAYMNLGEMEKAAGYARTAFELSGNVSASERFFIQYVYDYFTLADLDATEKVLREWTATYPLDSVGWVALTNAEIQKGNYAEAVRAGEQALKMTTQRRQLWYVLLARAYMRANRNADAKRLIAAAQADNMDGSQLHQILLEMAIDEHDRQSVEREIAWSRGRPEPYTFLEEQAIGEADDGKAGHADQLFTSAIASARREVGDDLADAMLVDEARVAVQDGLKAHATDLLKKVRGKGTIEYAVASAWAGDIGAAEAYIRKPASPPHGTGEVQILFPLLKALVAMNHRDPAGALAALQPAIPYELARCEIVELEGEASLELHQADRAEMAFKKLTANPGLEDPGLPRTTVAHLQLARAYALEGNRTQSAAEYKSFLDLWKDADQEMPYLKQARQELATLQTAAHGAQ